ncbi:MAG: hypothetical protein JXL97_10320 [Bacteroidales bacterium]|nr:hypothetical protein [Bacteroidales bacterium]
MKKNLFVSFLLLIGYFSAFSQTLEYGENFDTYSNGDKIAQTAGDPWTTWVMLPEALKMVLFLIPIL